jgi:hypothetical protein
MRATVLMRIAPSLIVALATMTGCAMTDRDVSHDPAFLLGYQPGQIYRLQESVNLAAVDESWRQLLPAAETRHYQIIRAVPAGTRIQIISLRHMVYAAPIQWGTAVITYATLVGQPGYNIDLNRVSDVEWVQGDWNMKTPLLLPNPHWLRLETAP